MFSILEITILAMVLSPASADFMCRQREDASVLCGNGLTARLIADDTLRFSNFVDVHHAEDGSYVFSNGIRATRSAAGGVWFSTGLSTERRSYNTYDFSNNTVCQLVMPDTAECRRTPPR